MGNIEAPLQKANCSCPTYAPTALLGTTDTQVARDSDVAKVPNFKGRKTLQALVRNNSSNVFYQKISEEKSSNYLSTNDSISFVFAANTLSPPSGMIFKEKLGRLATTEYCTCLVAVDDKWLIHRYITALVSVIICSVIIVANLLIIGNILWSLHQHYARRRRTRSKRSYIFMLNLALADLLVSLQ